MAESLDFLQYKSPVSTATSPSLVAIGPDRGVEDLGPQPEARTRPIKLLVVPDKYAPDECGGGGIYTDMCRGLAARGFDVTVRCPYPFYPEWTDKSGKNGLKIDRYDEQGVHVERHGFAMPTDPKSLRQRMMVDASFLLSLSRSLFRGKFGAVMGFCPHTGGLAHAAMVSRLQRIPLWLNVQDIPADAAFAGGMNRSPGFGRLLQSVQRFLFNRGDLWSTISPVMMERLWHLRDRDQPQVFLPNWTHESLAREIRLQPSKLGRPVGRPVRLLYSGNIGTKQGLLEFCEVLARGTSPFDFLIRGGGGGADAVRRWVEASGDARFRFGPLGPEADLARALHEADLFVVTEKAGSGSSFFPSKTVPSLASGTPILAVSDACSPLGREVAAEGLGPRFSWDGLFGVDRRLTTLGDQPGEFEAWQRNALSRSRSFERENCLDVVARTVESLIAGRPDLAWRANHHPRPHHAPPPLGRN